MGHILIVYRMLPTKAHIPHVFMVLHVTLLVVLFIQESSSSQCGSLQEKKGDFAFTAKSWIAKIANQDDSVVIDCTTNNGNATVYLQFNPHTVWLNLTSDSDLKVNQVRSVFVIPQIDNRYLGYYRCVATLMESNICLVKGPLFVAARKNIVIEILPRSPIIAIEGEQLSFYCLAQGTGSKSDSLLKWYKQTESGKVPLDGSLITNDGYIAGGKGYDKDIVNIERVKKSDAGIYICERAGSATEFNKTEVRVQGPVAPEVTLQPLRREERVTEGSRIEVVCKDVKGEPKPTKEWRSPKGEVLLKCDQHTETCTLRISSVSYDKHHGKFTCVGKNSGGSSSIDIFVSVLIGVQLQKGPAIDVARFKDQAKLTCMVEKANPLPTFTWFYQIWSCPGSVCKPVDDQWTKAFTKVSVAPPESVAANTSILTVPPSQITAFYSCQASNGLGTDFRNMTLHRLENPPTVFKISATRQSVNENDTFHLNCTTSASIYKSVKWVKNEKTLVEEPPRLNLKTLETKDFLRVTVIKFNTVKLSDTGDYKCIGKMANGTEKTIQHILNVKALAAPFVSGFVDRTVNQSFENVVFLCNATGNPLPKITWKLGNKKIDSVGYLDDIKACNIRKQGFFFLNGMQKNRLAICDMSYKKHEGTYTCTASNIVSSASVSMKVHIYSKPMIVKWHENVGFEPGSKVRLFCEADGNPSPNVTIFRVVDAKESPLEGQKRYNNGSVYISFESDSHTQGRYLCSAENKYGASKRFANVVIQGRTSTVVKEPLSSSIVAAIVVSCLVFVAIVILVAFLYKRKLDKKYAPYLKPNKYFEMDPDRTLFDQCSELPYDPDWEFPRDRLNFLKMIGSGAFGEVWLAEAQGILTLEPRDKTSNAAKRRSKIRKSQRYTHVHGSEKKKNALTDTVTEKTLVAVKTLKGDASDNEYKDLASELKILIHLGEHKQIVNLMGACTRGGKLCVVLEYCPHGSLLNFLRDRRDIFQPTWFKNEPDMAKELTYIDLTMIAYQIAKGMDFLASKKCVHRDIAARNVLIGVDFLVKVADFGLARDIYKDELYIKSTSGLLPVKWMAPESLFDKIYTSQSDVWSYGIVLWEIFTLGGSPYPGLPTEDLFPFLEQGRRMEQPEWCPLEFYALMNDCWEKNPNDRPLFSQLVDRIGQIISNRSGQDNPYLQFECEDGAAKPSDSDYLIPIVKKKSSFDDDDDDDYISPVVNTEGKRNQESADAHLYLNDDAVRMSLLHDYDSHASDYNNTGLCSDEIAV
ncbi:vascular endothelial growth factor receptor 2-like [Rhopilema esculentum]|uniref:vascular endothelial growth factor receptor 2-like n=1 Tax=Rhopilema esculentum TaxID=499914 RepID=UPI0031E2E8D3